VSSYTDDDSWCNPLLVAIDTVDSDEDDLTRSLILAWANCARVSNLRRRSKKVIQVFVHCYRISGPVTARRITDPVRNWGTHRLNDAFDTSRAPNRNVDVVSCVVLRLEGNCYIVILDDLTRVQPNFITTLTANFSFSSTEVGNRFGRIATTRNKHVACRTSWE